MLKGEQIRLLDYFIEQEFKEALLFLVSDFVSAVPTETQKKRSAEDGDAAPNQEQRNAGDEDTVLNL